MIEHLKSAVVMLVILTLITGVVYPLAVTGVAQILFPKQANGSLIYRSEQGAGSKVIGSELIGQKFASARYFHSRPSAAGNGYDAMASGGSNLGPTSKTLVDRVKNAADQWRAEASGGVKLNASSPLKADASSQPAAVAFDGLVPVDLVTASGSGLDPDISPAAAALQISRVAQARSMSRERVEELVHRFTEPRQFGVLGEPRVNVLRLNLALDASTPASPKK
ncbi:MAG: potassium-transporting ATPase subunit C [Phycisphaerae bacterium]|nr:potassium-transporting ATPase subunit C [Phycisphaerae bacterium]